MAANARSSTTMATHVTRRYWRRADSPRSWWPWGLLAALGLLILYLFGAFFTAPAIEAEVDRRVTMNLENAGIAVAILDADGQDVTGTIETEGPVMPFVEALAAGTSCMTWAGELACPTSVALERNLPEPAPAVPRPHRFQVLRGVDVIILRGEVPSAAERERLDSVAREHFGRVRNELRISGVPASPDYAIAADTAIGVVRHLENGQATWTGERLHVTGIAEADNVAAARDDFEKERDSGILGDFDLQVVGRQLPEEIAPKERKACNDAFRDELSTATIQFRTASAAIDTSSAPLLQRLAALAGNCPGSLIIEGHTDSQGDEDMNKALSLARATAVRDALEVLGVDGGRMRAVGFGESQPVAGNDTPEGRARNRRIVISVEGTD